MNKGNEMLNATILVQDFLLPEAANDEIANPDALPQVERWVLTNDRDEVERYIKDGAPVIEAGELYAIGLMSENRMNVLQLFREYENDIPVEPGCASCT
jgi:hypothetical protein